MWHFHFKNDRGEWTSKSTCHRDKKGAVQWAEAFSSELTRSEWGIAKPERLHGNDAITESLDAWLEYQKVQTPRTTYRGHVSVIKMFKLFLATVPASAFTRHQHRDNVPVPAMEP